MAKAHTLDQSLSDDFFEEYPFLAPIVWDNEKYEDMEELKIDNNQRSYTGRGKAECYKMRAEQDRCRQRQGFIRHILQWGSRNPDRLYDGWRVSLREFPHSLKDQIDDEFSD